MGKDPFASPGLEELSQSPRVVVVPMAENNCLDGREIDTQDPRVMDQCVALPRIEEHFLVSPFDQCGETVFSYETHGFDHRVFGQDGDSGFHGTPLTFTPHMLLVYNDLLDSVSFSKTKVINLHLEYTLNMMDS